MSSKKEKKSKSAVTSSSSKVPLPNFLNPELSLYTTEFYYACFYISSVLIDRKFVHGETYLKIDQLEEEMNKITIVGEYKNEKLSVVDIDTNKEMIEIVSKYDPDLACWHNFHILTLITYYTTVAGFTLESLKSWEKDARTYAWCFLLQYYKACDEVEGFKSNDYLDDCFTQSEKKKTFNKYVKDYNKN